MSHPPNQLTAANLACVRGDATLFTGLHLHIEGGEVLQLHGANGSGKTSLLRILCGLSPPAAGTVRWNDVDIAELSDGFRGALSYIGHRRGVCEELTPLENLEFACALDQPHGPEDCRAALGSLGLSHRLDTPSRLLSAGQVQRTALARLFTTPTPLWLLDEPFTALDSGGRARIEQVLQDHARTGGIAVVATHQSMNLGDVPVKILNLDDRR